MTMDNPPAVIPALPDCRGVCCGLTTRRGGVSKAPYDSLNLGAGTGDDPAAVEANVARLVGSIGCRVDGIADMHQVHGTTVSYAGGEGTLPATDALVTDIPRLLIVVRVADCVPVILHAPSHSIAAVVHCGWRSLTGGILRNTARMLEEKWGAAPRDCRAAVGPGAGVCCYGVGREVANAFDPAAVEERGGRLYADLHAETLLRLNRLGFSEEAVEPHIECTVCNPATYFSHRRDGARSGRMMGFAVLREEG